MTWEVREMMTDESPLLCRLGWHRNRQLPDGRWYTHSTYGTPVFVYTAECKRCGRRVSKVQKRQPITSSAPQEPK